MNKEIKALWLTALRSGEYRQTTEKLRDENGYCCLGVLCDLHAKETYGAWIVPDPNNNGLNRWDYKGEYQMPPIEVNNWASIDGDPKLYYKGEQSFISELNDLGGVSFKIIAKLIEKQL